MKARTIDNSTFAALPGSLQLSKIKYSKYFGDVDDPSITNFVSSLPWLTHYIPYLGTLVYHWTMIKEHFLYGCLIPAKIVDTSRSLVAAYTNLAAIEEVTHPVVKIWKERLDLIDGGVVYDGSRFAAVSTYHNTPECYSDGRWSDVEPYIVDCLVEERSECDLAKSRISSSSWEKLDLGLESLGEIKEGLHVIDVPFDTLPKE